MNIPAKKIIGVAVAAGTAAAVGVVANKLREGGALGGASSTGKAGRKTKRSSAMKSTKSKTTAKRSPVKKSKKTIRRRR